MSALPGTVAAVLGVEDGAESERLARRVEEITRSLSPEARLGVRAGAWSIDALARVLTGRPLSRLDADRREAVCAVLTARSGGARLVEAIKIPLLFAVGDHRPPTGPYDDARPDAELDCTPSDEWPECTVADAIVIGSGAGGAMAARTLARAGMSVIVLEEGRRYTAEEFRARPPLDRFLDIYRDGGSTVALGRPPVLLPEGRAVGGSTLINNGTSFRTPAKVLKHWADLGAPVDGFGALLDEVEATLQVAQQPMSVLGRNGLLALAGARELGWRAAPLRRNAPGCGGCCECAAGCPRNAKNGVHLSVLPQACADGARIVTHARAERIVVERGRAAGIVAQRPDGSTFEILAPLVFVAAGAIQTPPLLRRSGLGGHPGLGRGLAVHPCTNLAGRFDEPVVSWSGVMQSVGVEELHDDGILIEATASPPGMSSFVLPGVGRALRREVAGADRLAIIGTMIADGPSGRVYGRRRPVVRYDLAPPDAARLRRALVAMGRLMFAAGAWEVLTGLPRRPLARTVAELTEIVSATPAAELHLAAFHPTGTARLGADPERFPVAPDGRLRGVDGVYVSDASVLPTCPEVNPQLTIMAMALRISTGATGLE